MTLEEKLKERYQDDLEDVDDLEQLNLDSLITTSKLSDKDRLYLERFCNTNYITFNGLGLSTVENLPKIPKIKRVISLKSPKCS
jgi:hypothetical protein